MLSPAFSSEELNYRAMLFSDDQAAYFRIKELSAQPSHDITTFIKYVVFQHPFKNRLSQTEKANFFKYLIKLALSIGGCPSACCDCGLNDTHVIFILSHHLDGVVNTEYETFNFKVTGTKMNVTIVPNLNSLGQQKEQALSGNFSFELI